MKQPTKVDVPLKKETKLIKTKRHTILSLIYELIQNVGGQNKRFKFP